MPATTSSAVLSQSLLSAQPLLEVFRLEEIGVDRQKFLHDLAPTFIDMPHDRWDQKRMQVEFLRSRYPSEKKLLDHFLLSDAHPDELADYFHVLIERLDERDQHMLASIQPIRSRTVARFQVRFPTLGTATIARVEAGPFIQYNLPPDDPRSAPRIFPEAPLAVTSHPGMLRIIEYASLTLKRWRSHIKALDVFLHQTCMFSTPERAFILPDGIHQDGTDYIVSALPVILDGVSTPLSTVYNPDRSTVLQHHLEVGEGLFHDDRYYWHGVSTLKNTNGLVGRRGTFGLDLKLVQ